MTARVNIKLSWYEFFVTVAQIEPYSKLSQKYVGPLHRLVRDGFGRLYGEDAKLANDASLAVLNCWVSARHRINPTSKQVNIEGFRTHYFGARNVLDSIHRQYSTSFRSKYLMMEALIQQCWIDSYLQYLGLNDSLALQISVFEQMLDDYMKLDIGFPSSVSESKFLPLQKAYGKFLAKRQAKESKLVPSSAAVSILATLPGVQWQQAYTPSTSEYDYKQPVSMFGLPVVPLSLTGTASQQVAKKGGGLYFMPVRNHLRIPVRFHRRRVLF